jgi:hypothetical protein
MIKGISHHHQSFRPNDQGLFAKLHVEAEQDEMHAARS